MAKTLESLLSAASTIRREWRINENTAERVGGWMCDVVEYLKARPSLSITDTYYLMNVTDDGNGGNGIVQFVRNNNTALAWDARHRHYDALRFEKQSDSFGRYLAARFNDPALAEEAITSYIEFYQNTTKKEIDEDGNETTTGVSGYFNFKINNLTLVGGKIFFGDSQHFIERDADGNFYFSHGVYSESFASALGKGVSGGSSATSFLTDLLDVNKNMSPNPDDVLTFDVATGKWTAKPAGLDNDAVQTLINNSLSGYATQQWVTNKGYLTQSVADTLYMKKGESPDFTQYALKNSVIYFQPVDATEDIPAYVQAWFPNAALKGNAINNGYIEWYNGGWMNMRMGRTEVQELVIGDAHITYDSSKKGLKITGAGLYSESYTSALGAGSSSGGGGGVMRFTELVDVKNLDRAAGQVFGWNGTDFEWVNQTSLEGYAQESWVKANYGVSLGVSGNSITLKNGNGTQLSSVTVPYATTTGGLKTAVQLWGNSFNGKSGINGDIKVNGGIFMPYNGSYARTLYSSGGVVYIGDGTRSYGKTQVAGKGIDLRNSANTLCMHMNDNGNFGIGTEASTYKFDVNGSIKTNSNFDLVDSGAGGVRMSVTNGEYNISPINAAGAVDWDRKVLTYNLSNYAITLGRDTADVDKMSDIIIPANLSVVKSLFIGGKKSGVELKYNNGALEVSKTIYSLQGLSALGAGITSSTGITFTNQITANAGLTVKGKIDAQNDLSLAGDFYLNSAGGKANAMITMTSRDSSATTDVGSATIKLDYGQVFRFSNKVSMPSIELPGSSGTAKTTVSKLYISGSRLYMTIGSNTYSWAIS